MGNSFGCSASGERLVSAARDGDLQEAQALLECNPRLAKYSTFGVRNSPLHFSAMQGHNEVGFPLAFINVYHSLSFGLEFWYVWFFSNSGHALYLFGNPFNELSKATIMGKS